MLTQNQQNSPPKKATATARAKGTAVHVSFASDHLKLRLLPRVISITPDDAMALSIELQKAAIHARIFGRGHALAPMGHINCHPDQRASSQPAPWSKGSGQPSRQSRCPEPPSRKITIDAQQLPQLTASMAAYLAPDVHSPTCSWKMIVNSTGILALAAGITLADGDAAWQAARAQSVTNITARVIAVNVPGASAISQVGTFLNNPVPPACANPIPTKFPAYTQPGAVLDPNRILVGSQSNFGAPPAIGLSEGSFLSIDPSGPGILNVPPNFAQSGVQASALGGAVQMFSASSPHWYNAVNNFGAKETWRNYRIKWRLGRLARA
jgi:hypothetical protein